MADIVFLVLAVFMVQVPPLCSCFPIELPKVDHAVIMPGADADDSIVISINREGKIFLTNEQVASPELLPPKIRIAISRGAERRVYIRADGRAKYKSVLDSLACIRAAGLERVAFLTGQRPRAASE